jgi:hypothetical protein
MKVELRSTSKIVELVINGVAVPARIWEGHTASGIPCHAYITRIAVAIEADSREFDRELQAHQAPSPALDVIPLRMIL